MSDIKKQAEELGIKVDGRWSEDRLREEIEQKMSTQPEPVIEESVAEDPVTDPAVPADPVEPEPEVEAVESITITSLVQNPMRAFGLTGLGSSVVLTRAQLGDEAFVAKVERAEEFGFIKAE